MCKLFLSPFDVSNPLEQQRASMERLSKSYTLPRNIDIQPTFIGDMYSEWIRPADVRHDRAILYLHGGGYTMGSCNTHRSLAAWISAASQVSTFLIDYRLAPENPYPAALDDTINAFHYLIDQGIEPSKIIIAGDSAGGGLAIAATLSLRDKKEKLPGGIICISPWADLTMSGETMVTCSETDPFITRETSILHANRYVGKHDPKSPLISPIFADLSGFPPMIIQVGEYEVLRSDAVRLSENASRTGVDVSLEIWDGMWHVWHMLVGRMPESRRAIDKLGAFVRKCLGEDKSIGVSLM
jgi:acetyl esterase/lipase